LTSLVGWLGVKWAWSVGAGFAFITESNEPRQLRVSLRRQQADAVLAAKARIAAAAYATSGEKIIIIIIIIIIIDIFRVA